MQRLTSKIFGACAAIVLSAVAGSVILLSGLQEFAFTDYETEALPAVDRLVAGDAAGFLTALPGYGGALILQAPFALLGHALGGDADLWAWRLQALPGITALFVIGVVLGIRVNRSIEGPAGAAWGCVTAAFASATPFAMVAQNYGHTEEALVAGFVVLGVLLAARGNLALAGVLVGLAAAAKPWAIVAVPVVLLAAADRRELFRVSTAVVIAGLLLTVPTFAAGGTGKVVASAHTSTSGTFRPDNLFWFAGSTNPDWQPRSPAPDDSVVGGVVTNAPGWAQRLEPAWAAKVSHPAIVAFAVLLAAAFWRRRPRLAGREDLLLLLSAVCWWRCLLDTWNVHYYALAALLALTAWEARRGRPPVVAGVATTLAWTSFQIFPASDITPDLHTALYLAWALPLGAGMVARLLAPEAFARRSAVATGALATRLPSLSAALGSSPDARHAAIAGTTRTVSVRTGAGTADGRLPGLVANTLSDAATIDPSVVAAVQPSADAVLRAAPVVPARSRG
jgi:hypothetical protein